MMLFLQRFAELESQWEHFSQVLKIMCIWVVTTGIETEVEISPNALHLPYMMYSEKIKPPGCITP